jgi:hypothetical protein
MPATCFGNSYGNPQEGTLQRMDMISRDITEVREPMHRYKVSRFKNTWFKTRIEFQNTCNKLKFCH